MLHNDSTPSSLPTSRAPAIEPLKLTQHATMIDRWERRGLPMTVKMLATAGMRSTAERSNLPTMFLRRCYFGRSCTQRRCVIWGRQLAALVRRHSPSTKCLGEQVIRGISPNTRGSSGVRSSSCDMLDPCRDRNHIGGSSDPPFSGVCGHKPHSELCRNADIDHVTYGASMQM